MSELPILESWPEGIAAARIPANNNVRLIQALLLNPAISATTTAQPSLPVNPTDPPIVYIIPASATGAAWATFAENDVAIGVHEGWTAYEPFEGLRKPVLDEGADGENWQFLGGAWAQEAGGGGGSGDVVGPASSVADNLALFDGTTGKLLKDGGVTVAELRSIPQNSQSSAYTLVLADAGKHVYHPSADTTARIWTIPANGSVAFPIGTAVTFVNDTGAGAITIAITTDTLVLAGAGTTGSRTLAANGQATAIKVTSTRWQISGVGLT